MISFHTTDIFTTDAYALANTVNCVGAMGAGIALGVKNRWPAIYDAYRRECGIGYNCDGTPNDRIGPAKFGISAPCCKPGTTCRIHRVRPGIINAHATNETPVRYILNVPTKRHWYGPSLMTDVDADILALLQIIRRLRLPSIAIPPLGCGNGGLSWPVVRTKLIDVLGRVDCDIRIHAPSQLSHL